MTEPSTISSSSSSSSSTSSTESRFDWWDLVNLDSASDEHNNNNDDEHSPSAALASSSILGGLTSDHLEPIASRNWRAVLSWVAFHPDELSTLVDRERQTALHHACLFRAPLDVMQAMLFAAPELALARNDEGELALHWAVRLALPLQVLAILLEANPQSGFSQDKGGQTPLALLWDRHQDTLLDVYRIYGRDRVTSFPSWRRIMMLVKSYSKHRATTIVCSSSEIVSILGLDDDDHDYNKHIDDDENNNNYNNNSSDQPRLYFDQNQTENYPLHTIVQCPCEPSFFSFAVQLFHEELTIRDENGRLPLHCAYASSSIEVDLLLIVLQSNPDAASVKDWNGNLPLHIGIASGKDWWDGTNILFHANPGALGQRDAEHGLYPFMMAAVYDASVSTIYELLRSNPEYILPL